MPIYSLLGIFLAISLLFSACTENKPEPPQFKEVPQIQEVKPEKPTKIKLKRDAKDAYSWEISGDNVDEIIKTDKKLRKSLKSE